MPFGHNADRFQRRAQGGRNRRDYCWKIKRCRRSTGGDARERSIGDRLLAADEFEALANQFFAHPMASVTGWERALHAQARIVREVERVLARNRAGDVLLVGHGAVGTLLFCHYAGFAIDRIHDQAAGGGQCFMFAKDGRCLLHSWRRMEDLVVVSHRF